PSVEALLRERLDHMHARFDRLEHDVRTIAETVALHARYQLAVTPSVSQERQQEAIRLGNERFKVLAEQVDRRVRQCRPLMQEMTDGLKSQGRGRAEQATGEEATQVCEPQHNGRKVASECFDIAQGLTLGEGVANSHAYHHPTQSAGLHGVSRNLQKNPR